MKTASFIRIRQRVAALAAWGWLALPLAGLSAGVSISEERITLPTYDLGPPDPNPMFYAKESYQGAQKRVYPYPLQDFLTHQKTNRTYTSLNLENEYLKLSILPEIGGRLFSAVDKSNGYDFFYRQHVIKPALIGMLGAWISGGIEWCCFHHHRNTTFMPVDYALAENPDGSKTIWFGETERRHRMKWLIGITLYPGKSYLEATVKFFNRTPVPHSILYWANVAVHANDNYQVQFPPSVQMATYHSKIDFAHWPLANETYRGAAYRNVDISWWKNHPHPISFFAWDLQEDFMGGYDHGRQAGVVHVGNHHVVSGAKLWEWSPSPEGQMWDRILTDEDGPYAELMVGAWSDNQPDYSWIKPYEVKVFKQYWYPVRGLGGFKNANLNGAVNLEARSNQVALLGFHVTSRQEQARVSLEAKGQRVFDRTLTLSPSQPFYKEVALPAGMAASDLRAVLRSARGQELISYQPRERPSDAPLPRTVQPPPPPKDLKTLEELYLTGLRVEQIHSPSADPLAYYLEALARDAGDTRANAALGIQYLKRARYAEAETHLRKALERLTAEYTRARNGEAHYYLGLALRAQYQPDAAYDQFYRASWDQAFHAAAFLQLAELSGGRGDFPQALEQIDRSLATAQWNTKAANLKAAILRRLERPREAEALAARVLADDPLDFWALNERGLALRALGKAAPSLRVFEDLKRKMRGEVEAHLELATDYLNAGLEEEAIGVLERARRVELAQATGSLPWLAARRGNYPLIHYYLGYLEGRLGRTAEARATYQQAAAMPSDYCFPFRLEDLEVLDAALKVQPNDAKAWYYKGNLLYDLQPDQALECWEKSRALDDRFALVHRNLGWGYYRSRNNLTNALAAYERAVACSPGDPRLLLETDTLYETANVPPEKGLALLEQHHATVFARKESFLRELMALVLCGKYDAAIGHLGTNFFHVREGGGEIHDVYVDAHLLKGLELMAARQPEAALKHFEKAAEYPENLSVGRPKNDRRAPQVAFYLGVALDSSGQAAKAREQYQKAADQKDTASWPETRFYQALCLRRLGQAEAASRTFDDLLKTGRERLAKGEDADFFAKFGEQETKQAQRASAHYTLGLGLLGKGENQAAQQELAQAAKLNLSHVWARYHRDHGGEW